MKASGKKVCSEELSLMQVQRTSDVRTWLSAPFGGAMQGGGGGGGLQVSGLKKAGSVCQTVGEQEEGGGGGLVMWGEGNRRGWVL